MGARTPDGLMMLSRRTLVLAASLALSASLAAAVSAFPSRLRKDPFSDVVRLPVPLPVKRMIHVNSKDLSLVSIWQMYTSESSNGDLSFEPQFEFQGQPGSLGLLSVSVLGYDRTGKLVFRETQKASDGRLIDPKDAVVRAGTFMAARSRLSAPTFRIPGETRERLAKVDLVFEQVEPGCVFRPASPPSETGER